MPVGSRTFCRCLLALLALAALRPAHAFAQSDVPKLLGSPVTGLTPPPAPDDSLLIKESFVGILDSAVPFSNVRLRYDMGYRNRRPTRAEFFQSRAGSPRP